MKRQKKLYLQLFEEKLKALMISSIKSDVEIIGVDDPYLKLLGLYPSSSKNFFSSNNINKALFILRFALLLASNALRLFFFLTLLYLSVYYLYHVVFVINKDFRLENVTGWHGNAKFPSFQKFEKKT
jgi:hypothetical protein